MESCRRSVAKTVSWRALAVLVAAGVAWVITGAARVGLGIGIADSAVKMFLYYLHERAWNRASFGRVEPPEYEI